MSTIERHALGRMHVIGDYYDARKDCFVYGNVFNQTLPSEIVTPEPHANTNFDFKCTTTAKEKHEALKLEGELSLSVLAGLVQLGGSAEYLKESRNNSSALSCVYTGNVETTKETLNLANKYLYDYVASFNPPEEATHVVVGVIRGCNAFLTLNCKMDDKSSEQEIREALARKFSNCVDAEESGRTNTDDLEHVSDIRLRVLTDVPSSRNLTPMNIQEGIEIVREISRNVAATGEGVPIKYILHDVKNVSEKLKLSYAWSTVFHSLTVSQQTKIKKVFCESEEQVLRIKELLDMVQLYRGVLPQDRVKKISIRHAVCETEALELQQELANVLYLARSDPLNVEELYEIICSYPHKSISKKSMDKFMGDNDDLIRFMRFLEKLTSLNVTLISTPEQYQEIKRKETAHVLFYSLESLSNSNELWQKTTAMFYDLCEGAERQGICAAVNTLRLPQLLSTEKLEKDPFIVILKNDAYITKDLVAQLAKIEECNLVTPLVNGERHAVDSSKLVAAKLSCPNMTCRTVAPKHTWYCSRCHQLLEFDLKEHFYCGCGRIPIYQYKWKCSGEQHGKPALEFPMEQLKLELNELHPYNQVNILVIGETGAGKTTWINALPSYLNYSTFGEAEKEELHWLIPFKFTRSIATEKGVESNLFSYGESSNEVYASKKSCTQYPRSYYFKSDETVYCVIDTPGVGDCDGIEQDKKHMQNVVNYVCDFTYIHLICFLMRPDQARLHERFEFCFNELIMQFHRSAVGNVAFCFTKASGVNYEIGDTVMPLKTLLDGIKERRQIQIPFNSTNVFIFDNIAYLELAASKKGYTMDEDQLNTANTSFMKSRNATLKMMQHAFALSPHLTDETKKINMTRRVIQNLAEPLTRIGVKVKETIGGMEDRRRECLKFINNEKELLKILTKKVEFYRFRRVMITHSICKTCSILRLYRGDDRLPYIEAYADAAKEDPFKIWEGEELPEGSDCPKCGPNYDQLLAATRYYQDKHERLEEDVNVRRDLNSTKDRHSEIERLVKKDDDLVKELNGEMRKINEASSKFACFLRQNSIVPYNDVTEDYIRFAMEHEKNQHGRGTKRYQLLSDTLQQYFKEKDLLEMLLKNQPNSTDVSSQSVLDTLEDLKKMKHYGRDVKHAHEYFESWKSEDMLNKKVFVPQSKLSWGAQLGVYVKRFTGFSWW